MNSHSSTLHARAVLLLVQATILAGATRSSAGRDLDLVEVGRWPNTARDVAVWGAYAYCAMGDRLVELDLTIQLERIRLERGRSPGPTSQTAYLLGSGLFEIVDVSDPAAPKRLGALRSFSGRQVSVSGGYACVQVGFTTELEPPLMHVVDVRDPAQPRVVGLHHSEHVTVKPPYALVTEKYGQTLGSTFSTCGGAMDGQAPFRL